MRLTTRRTVTLVAAATLIAPLAACAASDDEGADDPTTSAGPTGVEALYAQVPDWSDCGDDLECATVIAPLDWNEPDGDTIDLAVNRHPATGDRIGSLVLNPGGPGGSGLELLDWFVDEIGDRVAEHYDLVGFDPRGVGESTPVSCLSDSEMDDYLADDSDPLTDAESYDSSLALGVAYGEACLTNTGDLLEHVGTIQAAKDLDLLRAVLGDEQLTYLGFSYGTFLGATYAALFPENVGRLVLDGAVDPTLSPAEDARVQAEGFENALRAYVADCQTEAGCPLTGTVDDGMAQIAQLLEKLAITALPTYDTARDLTSSLAFYGIITPLYDAESWEYLTIALDDAITDGDGSMLLILADMYAERDETGHYSNMFAANTAINCADTPAEQLSYDQTVAQLEDFRTVAPTMAQFFVGPTCAGWPVAAEGRLDDYSAAGADPILVVGTTNDPATPYSWAESLASILDSGVLLSYEGEGHTAYGSSTCIDNAVDAYLVDGTVPADGTRC